MKPLGIILTLAFTATIAAQGTATASLDELVTRIDSKLVEETERDLRAWLDARIAESGDFGIYRFMRDELRIEGDTLKVDLNRGGLADAAAQFFRAYEMLGDRKYLEAGLKTADFFLQVQQPGGRGLELMHLWPAWDVMGDWTARCLAVEDWVEVPIAEHLK